MESADRDRRHRPRRCRHRAEGRAGAPPGGTLSRRSRQGELRVDASFSYQAGNGQTYSPQNYDHKFQGAITLRWALEESRNIPAIKMMDTLGPKNVLAYAKRFGFEEDFPPYLPIALGAGDGTLLEVTSAYTAFANQGVRMTPFFVQKVKDREGNLLEENRG